MLDSYNFCKARLAEFAHEREELKPPRLISGHDLKKMGYTPGPQFKRILDFAEDLQLEGAVASREDAMNRILREFPAQ